MVAWTIKSVKRSTKIKNKDFIFIILKSHDRKYGVKKRMLRIMPEARYLLIDHKTQGAAETALMARPLVSEDEELIITDADQYYVVSKFEKARKMSLARNYIGIISTYLSVNPAYSYIKKDKNNFVTLTREKELISNEAAIGMYYFTKSKYFMQGVKSMLKKKKLSKNEYYVCPVYNEVLTFGKVITVNADFWMTMGSPDEVNRFYRQLQRPSKFLKQVQD